MSWLDWLEWILLLGGFAVLHLTWQTFAAGAVVAALASLPDRSSPQLRYAVALALLLSLPALALGTVVLISGSRDPGVVSEGARATLSVPVPWIATAVPWIGLLWGLGVMVHIGRLFGGAICAARIRSAGWAASEVLVESTRGLIERLRIRSPTPVRLSDRLRAPAVVGVLSPTVLLPPRMIRDLPLDELQAILAHELSHVRRRDLLANAAQRAVSALLFFHPVAAWISRVIDQERELCCDDLVTRIGVSNHTYARALARLALSCRAVPAAGLGAASGNVTARIRRLMGPSRTREPPYATVAAFVLIAMTLAGSGVVTRALVPVTTRAARTASAWQARVLADVPGSYTVNATDPAGEFTLSIANGRAVGATIDGAALARARVRQRGARVTLQPDRPGGTFSVTLLASGGIEWPARSAPAQN